MQIVPHDLEVHIEEMFGQISQFRQQNKNLETSLESFFRGSAGRIGRHAESDRRRIEEKEDRRQKAKPRCSTILPMI